MTDSTRLTAKQSKEILYAVHEYMELKLKFIFNFLISLKIYVCHYRIFIN